jgi:hypothetical protein
MHDPAPVVIASGVDVPIITTSNGTDIQIVASDVCETNYKASKISVDMIERLRS